LGSESPQNCENPLQKCGLPAGYGRPYHGYPFCVGRSRTAIIKQCPCCFFFTRNSILGRRDCMVTNTMCDSGCLSLSLICYSKAYNARRSYFGDRSRFLTEQKISRRTLNKTQMTTRHSLIKNRITNRKPACFGGRLPFVPGQKSPGQPSSRLDESVICLLFLWLKSGNSLVIQQWFK